MKNHAQLINAIPPARNPLVHSPLRHSLLLLALGVNLLVPMARAVEPPPGGGYPNANTALGDTALLSLTTGTSNTAIGFQSMFYNAEGSYNTAVGDYSFAGIGEGIASYNTAIGVNALGNMSFGNQNTASGSGALRTNIGGSNNTATGFEALGGGFVGSEASNNTADGANALYSNTTGTNNTASGINALHNNTTGSNNAAHGQGALSINTIGSNNTGVGPNALLNNTTGSSNIALGESAGSKLTTGKNNIDIGNAGTADESAKIRIGNKAHKNTYIAGISGVTVAGGVGVIIDTTGHLGTVTSSRRYKEAIQPMKASSEAILSLQPVKFRYKKELDAQGILQFGLVAEDVAKVNPDLVARDEEGKPYTVRYEAVNAMLLNEFLKEHRKVEQQAATIERQERRLTELERAVAELR